jgi:ATP-binding cassette subfamily F protein 3
LYDSYYFYRKAVLAGDISPAVPEAETKIENENTVRNANRAQERKESAKRRQRIAEIEKETSRLEAEQKELEAKFGGSCSSEDLKRYEDNANKLAALYDEYFELNED